ncbi:MAG: 23S rRNA (uracil(1939)-C(5))-methyltransferase RlmD [Gammaproteobacteria bacterium]|nr:23S rRNA (uracil(1939)-C(5))-methyltransferase RlmD [Gammaproteobacteria bacterium]
MSRGLASRPVQTADIIRLDHKGRGEADVPGRSARVHHTLPGEQVTFKRRRRRRGFDEAEIVELLRRSDHRVEPRCPHFGNCGGCTMQHIDSRKQVALKKGWYREMLAEYELEPECWLEPLTGPQWGYRRRARLGVKKVAGKGRVLVGFREVFKSYVADMDGCEILSGNVGELIRPLCELIDGLSICDRIPQIEVAVADNATALVFRVLETPKPDDLDALRQFAGRYEVRLYLQEGGLDTVQALVEEQDALRYRLPAFGLELEFAPVDFIQVNGALNEKMIELAIELLSPKDDEQVLDLFCGLGNFSLALARHCAGVTGIEGDMGLVERAHRNAILNNIDNAEFLPSDLFYPSGQERWMTGKYPCVVLDPPRSGASQIIPFLPQVGAQRIVYVSCNPASLARDAASLVKLGYDFKATGVMDMFPHTSHAEAIALFTRR